MCVCVSVYRLMRMMMMMMTSSPSEKMKKKPPKDSLTLLPCFYFVEVRATNKWSHDTEDRTYSQVHHAIFQIKQHVNFRLSVLIQLI